MASSMADVAMQDAKHEDDWKTKYTQLKKRFLVLQDDTLAVANAYELACEELQYQKECQAVLVEKFAEIRVRRMNMHLRVPVNGETFFLKQHKQKLRKLHPTATRKTLKELSKKEWDHLTDAEQARWETQFREYQARVKAKATKKATSTVPKKTLKASVASTSTSGNGAATPKTTAPKRRTPATTTPKPPSDAAKAKKRKTTPSDGADPTSVGTPAKKRAKPAQPKAPKAATAKAKKPAAPRKKKETPATGDEAEGASIKSPSAPKGRARASPAKKTTPKKPAAPKKQTKKSAAAQRDEGRRRSILNSSDDDLDDDDDDDDEGPTVADDESMSSAGGSGSDEDDDEFGGLPTGAFG
ncbi:hypothetical protein Poli38472_012976 [Pythium oligandrum]|uniref:HMG box domain-containing protein n=1 Tax=Pythium oligandrum TaxID=41045 RepID=A0A8K1CJS5_PYTOL|nr:hypothetical protein Poli38472_012976 [Pythium oligandrum]|eukprot:TMW64354.1 hypothetical protein Poli38472_012976 [Pythium oligandrum]